MQESSVVYEWWTFCSSLEQAPPYRVRHLPRGAVYRKVTYLSGRAPCTDKVWVALSVSDTRLGQGIADITESTKQRMGMPVKA